MPETKQNDSPKFVRERAHTSNKNTILMLPDIIRAYHVMGLLSQGEVDELNDMSNDNARLTFLKNKIPGLAPEQKLEFCEAFVGDDLTTFHGATPAIMAGAYRAAFAKAKDDPAQKERLQKIAARIDEMSADFANSGGMIINEQVIDTTNVADVYAGFADMLRARMGDVDRINGARKAEKIAARKQKMQDLGVPLSETQIARINNNLDVLESVIGQYDDLWGLSDITADNAPNLEKRLEDRWDRLDYRLARAEVYDETKEIMAKYKFLDAQGEEIPQFTKNGRRVLKGGRLYMIQELARHNVEKRHVGRIGEKMNADALEDEFNDEILFLLWNMKNQGQNMDAAMDDPEMFMDYTKRDAILDSMGQEGGEISDRAYMGMLFAHENATAGWLARIKTKMGDAAHKGNMDRFYDKAGVVNGADARMRERMQQFIRILKGFASAFIASTIITSVATTAALLAGLSPAAGIAIVGVVTGIGLSLVQFQRWKKNWEASQIAAGKPHDRETMRKAFFADKKLLASFGISAIAMVAMIFGAAGMAQAAMSLGLGALTLGAYKNGREAYFAARKRMSVTESLALAIANAGAIVGGGFAGRAVGHELGHELADWIKGRWPETTILPKEVATSHEHSITGDVEHSKTVINYPDGMIDRAEAAVRSWYAEQYPNNPEILQQHIDAVNQYNADYGTNLDPWVTLRAMELCNGHSGYGAPGWMHQYGYTSEQIAAGANAITADGYNPDGMARLVDLQTNHLDEFGHIGLVDGHVLRPNDLYSGLQHTPTQQTLSYSEPMTVVSDVPGVAQVPVHTPDTGMMAAYGTYDPVEESAPQRDRVGSMPDRMLERVLWMERSQAKKWKDLHKQLEKVIAARHKNPNPSLANELWAQQTDIQRLIEQLRNDLGHASDDEIERGIEAAEKREELLNCTVQIDKLSKRKPDATRGASKWDIAAWEKKIAELQAKSRQLEKELKGYQYYYAMPVEGVQAQKQREREERRRQQEEFIQIPDEIVKEPEDVIETPEEIVDIDSKYPMSDKVERIIKGMPDLPRKEGRDSLANIQHPSSGEPFTPVKALNGVFTWTHDLGFAIDILNMLPTEQERAQLLRETIDYYKERHSHGDGEFFNRWFIKDLDALVYNGTISLDTFNSLQEYFNEGRNPVKSEVDENVLTLGGGNDEQDEGIVFAPVPNDEPQEFIQEPQEEIVVPIKDDNTDTPVDELDDAAQGGNEVHGVNVGDIIRKPEDVAEAEEFIEPEKEIVIEPIREGSQPKVNTLQEAVLEAQGRRFAGAHEDRIYLDPTALERLAEQGNLTTTLDIKGNVIPKPIGTYNGLPFHLVDINGNGNPFADSADGPVVIVNWQGIRIPFVLATGMNPDNPVTPGKWYPVSMVLANGRFLNPDHTDAHIAYETGEYKNNSEREYSQLMEIAEYLDRVLGDIRNWRDAKHTEIGGCDVIPPVDAEGAISELQDSEYLDQEDGRKHMVYTPTPEYASRDTYVSSHALNEMEDPDWHKENYNVFGKLRRGVSRVGDAVSTVAQKIRGFFRRRERGEE